MTQPKAPSSRRAPPHTKTVRLVGVPLDLGQSERGTDVGPSALRYAGLASAVESLGYRVIDGGNVSAPNPRGWSADAVVDAIAEVTRELTERVGDAVDAGELPLVLGGDHSVAIGSIGAVARRGPLGVLWIDAHGDFNTPETSPSGNVHGMPLAVLLRKGDPRLVAVSGENHLRAEDVALVGVRQLDERERLALKEAGIHVFTMREIDERGMAAVARDALTRIGRHGRVHVSLDVDALDPVEAPGVATPVRGGLTYREAHLLLEMVADTGALTSMDVVEVNPMLDVRNRTAKTAVDLVVSALGRTIL